MSEDIFLVLSICEGRHLPSPPGYSVLAEAKFDYQILQSDPVPLTGQPNFNTELVWETDRRSLQQHRLHKNPVKVEFYATGAEATDLRQLLGYVVLDIRSATEQVKPADGQYEVKWHRMLGCRPKSQHELPSVQLGLCLEPNTAGASDNLSMEQVIELSDTSCSVMEVPAAGDDGGDTSGAPVHSPPTRGPTAAAAAGPDLTPRLDDERGCFQLGVSDHPYQEMFTLTVIVVYAQNLELLIPPDVDQLPVSSGFSFYFSLLDCDIITETFHNIVQPKFLAERVVTRVRAPLQLLQRYLQQLGTIDVYLCCGDLSLGSAAVPLQHLYSALHSLPTKRLVSEAAHPLRSSVTDRVPRRGDPLTGEAPAVGVFMELAHARCSGDGQSQLGGQQEKVSAAARAAPPGDSTVQLDDTELTLDGTKPHGSPLKLDSSGLSDIGSPEVATVRPADPPARSPPPPATEMPAPAPARTAPASPLRPAAAQDRPRHYRFVLDLRKLSLHEARRGHGLLKSSYPLFGDASELVSGPVPLTCRQPTTVPRAVFEFNFAATGDWLSATLRRFPAPVRLETEDGEEFASAHVPLLPVTQQKRVHTTSSLGVRGFQQNHYCTAELVDAGGATVGQLSVAMSLDDLGQVELDQAAPPPPLKAPATLAPPSEKTAQLEAEMYAAARELEQWKQDQKILFQNQLQQREAAHLATLTEEWKRRDAERELQLQKRLRDAVALEDKLRLGLTMLEERQKAMLEREDELVQLRGRLQEEHQQIAAEVRALTSEMETECQKRIREEAQKTADAEATAKRLEGELAAAEGRLTELQARVTPAGDGSRPDAEELERRLQAAVKSKLYYKQRWAETARELEDRRAADTRLARERLEREKLELDKLRAQVTAREETSFLSEERRLLEELRGQVRALTPRDAAPSGGDADPPGSGGTGGCAEQLRRLREERRVLLDTGLYTEMDAAVRELDGRISQLVTAGGPTAS